jgi:hypothetical protein
MYNLRNQTFALPRMRGDANVVTVTDPISEFYYASGATYGSALPSSGDIEDSQDSPASFPSNSDNLVSFYQADSVLSVSRTTERFKSYDMFQTKPPNFRAPMGYFVIDAFDRGTSRESEISRLIARNPLLTVDPSGTLPSDRTPNGPLCLGRYAGRVWYGGMSSKVIDGDGQSPRYESYLFFSQIVNNPNQINRCYQQADPTHYLDPDIADDDGGFIKLDGAYGIKRLVTIKTSLFVFAENGVWRVSGLEDNTFTATSYSISKVSDLDCVNGSSVVIYNDNCFYFGEEAIYILTQNQLGEWVVDNLTEETIKSFYRGLSTDSRNMAHGYYDYKTSSVRWIYGTSIEDITEKGNSTGFELVFNTRYKSFTKNAFHPTSSVFGPITVAEGRQFTGSEFLSVTANNVQLTANSVNLTTPNTNRLLSPSEGFYCILTNVNSSNEVEYTFGGYDETTNIDWSETLPEAYLITVAITGGDARTTKSSRYLSVHFPNLSTNNSCLVSSRWGWSTDVSTGRWSSTRSAYRYSSKFDNIGVVTSRNIIRGSGKAVSFKFESDGSQPLNIYGWEFDLDATGNE